MSGMEEGRPPKGNWDLRAQDQGGKGHTGSRGMQRTRKEIVGYYCGGGGEESPPPFSTSAAQTGLVLRRGRTRTHSYICISRILRSRERERRELETQVGEEDISHPIPSIHPSRPPQLREAAHPRISSSPLPAPPEAARVRPRRSSSATDVATEHEKPTPKKKHPFNPISRRAPSVERRRRRSLSSFPLPPLFLSPICLLSGERLTHTTGGGGGGNRRKGAWKEEKSFGPLPPLPPQNNRGKGGFCQSSQSRR